MKAEDLNIVADVLGQALTAHRSMLEQLIEVRTRELVNAQRAVELVRDEVTTVEDRLREFVQRDTSAAVTVMRQAASEDLSELQGLLLARIANADQVLGRVRELHQQLEAVELRHGASAYEVAVEHGFDGSSVEWLQSLNGKDAVSKEGPPGPHGAGLESPTWQRGVHRSGTTVTAYLGQFYRALKDTTDEPYASAEWERIGTTGFHLAEPWNEGREYRDGDLFVRDFGLFLWTSEGAQLLVGRCPRGEPGQRGLAGKDAQPAKDGRDGASVDSMDFKGSVLSLLVRDHTGQLHSHDVDLWPTLLQLGEVIEQRLIERFQPLEG